MSPATPPPVSVGLPVYNGQPYLEEALESVLSQTYGDFELVISDNASTDATEEICRERAGTDERIRYLRYERNRGAAWNFNNVVHLARARYFKWINHDDLWAPAMLERSVEVLESAPVSVVLCYPRTAMINAGGGSAGVYEDRMDLRFPEPHRRLGHLVRHLRRCNAQFGLMRRDLLCRTRLLGGYLASDKVLLAELSLLGEFWELPDELFYRRLHPEGSTFAYDSSRERAAWFDPRYTDSVFVLPRWRQLVEHVRAVTRAPLSAAERRRCYAVLVREWLPRNREGLINDLKSAAVRTAARVIPAS